MLRVGEIVTSTAGGVGIVTEHDTINGGFYVQWLEHPEDYDYRVFPHLLSKTKLWEALYGV